MKNLPEKDFWKDVGNRLDAYTEEPDDDSWDKIAAAISPQRPPKGLVWIDRFAGLALLIYLSFMAGYSVGRKDTGATYNRDVATSPGVTIPSGSPGSNDGTEDGNRSVNEPSSRTRPAGPLLNGGDGSKKSVDQSLSGTFSHTTVRAQSSEGSALQLRSYSNEEGFQGISANDAMQSSSSSSSATASDGERKLLSDASVFASAAEEGTSSGTTDRLVHENRLHSGRSGVSAADSVLDSLAVKKVIKTDSTVRNTKAEPKTPAKKKQKIYPQLYFTLTPSLSFQKITPEQTDAVNVQGMRSPGILSSDRFGISFEAGLQRQLTKHLEVYTGISYYQQKQDLTYEYLSPDKVEVTSPANGQYTVSPQTEAREFKYSMLNAGLSAGLFYRIKGEKLMHKLGAGIQYQKGLLRAGSEDTYNNARSSYLHYQVSYRVEYLLNAKVNIFIQPTFIHSFYAKETLAEPFTIKPYRAGIGVGMIYNF